MLGGTSHGGHHLRSFACLLPEPGIRIFPILGPQRAKESMIFKVGLKTLTGLLALLMVKP